MTAFFAIFAIVLLFIIIVGAFIGGLFIIANIWFSFGDGERTLARALRATLGVALAAITVISIGITVLTACFSAFGVNEASHCGSGTHYVEQYVGKTHEWWCQA